MYTTLRKQLSKEAKIGGSSPSDNSSNSSDNSEERKPNGSGPQNLDKNTNKSNRKRTKLVLENNLLATEENKPLPSTADDMDVENNSSNTSNDPTNHSESNGKTNQVCVYKRFIFLNKIFFLHRIIIASTDT